MDCCRKVDQEEIPGCSGLLSLGTSESCKLQFKRKTSLTVMSNEASIGLTIDHTEDRRLGVETTPVRTQRLSTNRHPLTHPSPDRHALSLGKP